MCSRIWFPNTMIVKPGTITGVDIFADSSVLIINRPMWQSLGRLISTALHPSRHSHLSHIHLSTRQAQVIHLSLVLIPIAIYHVIWYSTKLHIIQWVCRPLRIYVGVRHVVQLAPLVGLSRVAGTNLQAFTWRLKWRIRCGGQRWSKETMRRLGMKDLCCRSQHASLLIDWHKHIIESEACFRSSLCQSSIKLGGSARILVSVSSIFVSVNCFLDAGMTRVRTVRITDKIMFTNF